MTRSEAIAVLEMYQYTPGVDSTRRLPDEDARAISDACQVIAEADAREAERQAKARRLAELAARKPQPQIKTPRRVE